MCKGSPLFANIRRSLSLAITLPLIHSATISEVHFFQMSAIKSLLRRSSQLRRFCTDAVQETVKKKRLRPKTIQEVGSYLPERGLGAKFTRLLWIRNGYENSYWTITKIEEKNKGRIRYYGKRTWKGVEDPRERPVLTGQKRGWRFILDDDLKRRREEAKKSLEMEGNSQPSMEPLPNPSVEKMHE